MRLETEAPACGYRPCVGIFLLSADRQVFVGQRLDTPAAAWQLPQGGIDPGEDAETAGRREMLEEIGTDKARFLARSRVWRSYDLPPELAKRMWRGRYKGQTQLWLAFGFEGEDKDIRLDTEHPEFAAWRWMDPERLPDLAVSFKRAIYLSVVDEFRHLWA
jgi:putative (di)nucleoside polyphosphate hydrolase